MLIRLGELDLFRTSNFRPDKVTVAGAEADTVRGEQAGRGASS